MRGDMIIYFLSRATDWKKGGCSSIDSIVFFACMLCDCSNIYKPMSMIILLFERVYFSMGPIKFEGNTSTGIILGDESGCI